MHMHLLGIAGKVHSSSLQLEKSVRDLRRKGGAYTYLRLMMGLRRGLH